MPSVDVNDCKSRWYNSAECRCEPKCAICGHGKHSGVHGPVMGKPPGSAAWGHDFVPGKTVDQ